MPRDWNHIPDPTPDATACPDCGALIQGGLAACRALFHESIDGFGPTSLRHGRMRGDSYALQHLEPYCRTAKELVYHVASLCCGIEYDGNPTVYKALQRSIEGKFTGDRPTPPAHLGHLTILHLEGVATQSDYDQRLEEWAHSVWDAYTHLHELARRWIKQAAGW